MERKLERVLSPAGWGDRRPSALDDIRLGRECENPREYLRMLMFRRDSRSDETRIQSAFDDLRRDSAKPPR